MITGNLKYKLPFEAFRLAKILPAMAENLVKENGYGKEETPARVNWGRWIWDCECGGSEFAFDEGWGMCRNCFNGWIKHKYRPVLFPRNRKAIELLLINRPLENRNWFPGESLEKLRAENKEHKGELI